MFQTTIKQLIPHPINTDHAHDQLRAKYTQSDVTLLIAASIRKDATFIYTHPEYRLSAIEYLRFGWYLRRYHAGYSIAAIIGHKEFFGLDFFVNRHTLIPRPDTELMVAEALTRLTPDTTLTDVGTGSGCIPISIAKNFSYRPTDQAQQGSFTIYATDISTGALRIARRNAVKHDVAITFFHGNLLTPLKEKIKSIITTNTPLLITANLPYLTKEQFAAEPSIQYEPYTALVADHNGIALYEKLLEQLHQILAAISKDSLPPIILLFEIDPTQTALITKSVHTIFPIARVEIKNDLAGRDRLVIISL